MRLQYSDLDSSTRLIKLSGTLDIYGVGDVEIDFVRLCTGDNVCILVDLSRVDYISSIGIPLLINSARSLMRQGGKMALLKPQKAVENVLELTGIPLIIPIYETVQAAVAELKK
ncbi:MAG TPA: STAS domain-containing protein [Anaerolineales bacterium]|jgi:anti-anti-sigma factor|nr:STAS domain-containing protein [Anaerolineales bacterium]